MTPATAPPTDADAVDPAVARQFEELADEWTRAVAVHSSSSIRNGHPAYRAIVALGPAAVPLLLRDLERTHRHWFQALAEITGENPNPPEHAGRVALLADDWLRWGRAQGYRW